jgi:hypothetical protein
VRSDLLLRGQLQLLVRQLLNAAARSVRPGTPRCRETPGTVPRGSRRLDMKPDHPAAAVTVR